jgi:hypothetical protein
VSEQTGTVSSPEGRGFAFTVFDDPDGQSLATSRLVYSFLKDLGLRTTIAVWPLAPRREANSAGETCGNPEYLEHVQRLADAGFEIAWHNAAPHDCTREETLEGLERFREYFGRYPVSMANHYNAEALYWGDARLSGIRRKLHALGKRGRYYGHVEGHPGFWGDVCRERIRYCRNFVFTDLNTLRACPWMPYHDPERPFVQRWFAASEGAEGPAFLKLIAERNQDRLEEEGGAAIAYTHFGRGFVENGRLHPEFRRLMERLAKKNGWFVPASEILDYLAWQKGVFEMDAAARRRLEWRWLPGKILRGTS